MKIERKLTGAENREIQMEKTTVVWKGTATLIFQQKSDPRHKAKR